MPSNIKKELRIYGQKLSEKGLTAGISGNLSAKIEQNVLITASGSANDDLEENDLVLINLDGEIVQGEKRPSSEKFLHLEFYKQRPDINAIFHVHSPYLTAFATCGLSLDTPLSPEIIYCFGNIPLAQYALPGSKKLVENTAKFFKDYDIILMENHGVIVGGKNIKDAYQKLDLAESYAKMVISTKALGGAKPIPTDEVEKIYKLRNE